MKKALFLLLIISLSSGSISENVPKIEISLDDINSSELNGLSCKVYDTKNKLSHLEFSKDGKKYAFLESKYTLKGSTYFTVWNLITDGKKYDFNKGRSALIGFDKNSKLALIEDGKIFFDGKESKKYKDFRNPGVSWDGNIQVQVFDDNSTGYPSGYYLNGEDLNFEQKNGFKPGTGSAHSMIHRGNDYYYIYEADRIKRYSKHMIIKNGKPIVKIEEGDKRITDYTVSSTGEIAYVRDDPKVAQQYRVIRGGKEIGIYNDRTDDLIFSEDGKDLYFRVGIGTGKLYKNGELISNEIDTTYTEYSNDMQNYIYPKTVKTGEYKSGADHTGMPFIYCDKECRDETRKIYVLNGEKSREYKDIIKVGFSPNNKHYAFVKDLDDKEKLIYDGKESAGFEVIGEYHIKFTNNELVYWGKDFEGNLIVMKGGKQLGNKVKAEHMLDFEVLENGDVYYSAKLKKDTFVIVKNGEVISTIYKKEIKKRSDLTSNNGKLHIFSNGDSINYIIENSLFMCNKSFDNKVEDLKILNTDDNILNTTK